MRESKRKQLAARGWKAGSTAEFLGLTQEEERLVDLRLRLAEGLRQRRLQRQLTQSDVARTLRSSQSRVAKMEAADPSVSIDLLVRSLLALGATNRDLSRLIG